MLSIVRAFDISCRYSENTRIDYTPSLPPSLLLLREMVVFKEGDQIYHSKILSFYRKSSFELRASYQLPSLLPYPSPHVGTFSVKDVKPTESGEASKIKVKVRLSIHGIFFVKSASLIEKLPAGSEEAMETDKPATVAGNSTDSSDVSQGKTEYLVCV